MHQRILHPLENVRVVNQAAAGKCSRTIVGRGRAQALNGLHLRHQHVQRLKQLLLPAPVLQCLRCAAGQHQQGCQHYFFRHLWCQSHMQAQHAQQLRLRAVKFFFNGQFPQRQQPVFPPVKNALHICRLIAGGAAVVQRRTRVSGSCCRQLLRPHLNLQLCAALAQLHHKAAGDAQRIAAGCQHGFKKLAQIGGSKQALT